MLTSEDDWPGPEIGPLQAALADSIRSAGLAARDQAAAALGAVYAKEIDLGGDPVKVGPQLLRVLDALQLTPKSRAVAQRGGTGEPPAAPSRLDELRARREGKRYTPAVDTAAEGTD